MKVGEQEITLALNVGDSVYVEIGDEIVFSGEGAKKNEFLLADFQKHSYNSYTKQMEFYQWCSTLPADSIKTKLEARYAARTAFLNKFKLKDSTETDFYAHMAMINDMDISRSYMGYPQMMASVTRNYDNISIPKKEFFDRVLNLKEVNHPSLISNFDYYYFVSYYLNFYVRAQILPFDTVLDYTTYSLKDKEQVVDSIAKEILAPEITERLKAEEIMRLVNFGRKERYTPKWEKFKETATNENYKADLRKKIAYMDSLSTQSVLSNGFAIEISDTASNGVVLNQFFTENLGKYIYLDLWSMGCRPCVEEIPYSNKLQEKFKDENVVFVNICIDGKKYSDRWKTFIQKKEWKGQHLITTKENYSSPVAKNFGMSFVPRYVLINPEGKVERFIAERPSSGAREMLEDLLKKTSR